MATTRKPVELVELYDLVVPVYEHARQRLGELNHWTFSIAQLDVDPSSFHDDRSRLAFLIRKLQAIRSIASVGVDTDVRSTLGLLAETGTLISAVSSDEGSDAFRNLSLGVEEAAVVVSGIAAEFGPRTRLV